MGCICCFFFHTEPSRLPIRIRTIRVLKKLKQQSRVRLHIHSNYLCSKISSGLYYSSHRLKVCSLENWFSLSPEVESVGSVVGRLFAIVVLKLPARIDGCIAIAEMAGAIYSFFIMMIPFRLLFSNYFLSIHDIQA